jgi:hypothetical protein
VNLSAFLPVGYPGPKGRTASAARIVNRDMSYDPSHRKPRHAGRMPQVITPEEAWPALDDAAYADGAGYEGSGQGVYWSGASYQNPSYQEAYPGYADHAYRGAANGYTEATNGYNGTTNGYPQAGNDYPRTSYGYTPGTNGYPQTSYGYAGSTDAFHGTADDNADGWGGWAMGSSGHDGARDTFDGHDYGGAPDGYDYGGAPDGYGQRAADGFDGAYDGFDGSTGYSGYSGYAEPTAQDLVLMAPDAGLDPDGWRARRGPGDRRGLIVGAVIGFLSAAMAIGVATLAAAFVRPQASPIIAVGEAFIDRTPPALKNFAVQRFGENDKTMLLLGMYVTIALIAMGIGLLARRTATLGVVGIAAFGLFGAFVAITRPASRASDVIPSVIGGIAGVAALLWLERASAPTPVTPVRPSSPRPAQDPGPAQHGRRAR